MLIPSKLSRPVRLDHTVVRERLLAKLSGANNFRLALITSPAGYGKTTLISQWAAGKNDIGWYSLDEGDNQQERFASYLIAAVQQATNGHCAICETMAQKRQYASLTSLFAQLFSAEAVQTSTKLIYTANLTIESKDFDAARTALTDAVSAAGGYLGLI